MKNLKRILESQRDELKALDVSALCTRKEEQEVQLNSNLAQVVIGVRRSGKSTLCQKVLIEKGVHFAYVNFDDDPTLCIMDPDGTLHKIGNATDFVALP